MSKNTNGSVLDKLGFRDEEKLEKFLSHASHKFIQKRFDEVFPPTAKEFTKLTSLTVGSSENALGVALSTNDDGADELDLGSDLVISHSSEEEVMSDDKELDLSDAGELSLGDDTPSEAAPADEGLDLSLGGDLELSAGDDELSLGASEETVDNSEMTSLKIGDAVNLDEDVLSKLAEIDAIMQEDATKSAMMRPTELKEDPTNPGLDLSDSLSEDGEGLSVGDDNDSSLEQSNDLNLEAEGGDDLLSSDSDSSDILQLGGLTDDSEGDELVTGSGTSSGITDPGTLDGPDLISMDLGEDVNLFEAAPAESSAPKKALPMAPPVVEVEEEDEGLSFGAEERTDAIIAPPKKADRTAELKVPENFGKKKAPPAPVAPPIEVEAEDDVDALVAAPVARSTSQERSDYREVVGNYNHELERLQATLNHLRADRDELLKKIEVLEEDKLIQNRHVLGMRAELDEKKIEVQLFKKRMLEEGQDQKYQLELEQERRKLAEERAKAYQLEVQTLQQKVKMEVKKVSSREKELEQKLELLKSDAETQIRHRDLKILELKRRIDAMEFDLDAMNVNEQKSAGDKQELEGKLDKAIKTLRMAIGILETDDPKLATLEKLKKNLDV